MQRKLLLACVVTIDIITIVLASVFYSLHKLEYIIGSSIFLISVIFNVIFNYKFWKISKNKVTFSPKDCQRVSPKGIFLVSLIFTIIGFVCVTLRVIIICKKSRKLSASEIIIAYLEPIFVLIPALPFSKSWMTTIVQVFTSARLLHVSEVCLVCNQFLL